MQKQNTTILIIHFRNNIMNKQQIKQILLCVQVEVHKYAISMAYCDIIINFLPYLYSHPELIIVIVNILLFKEGIIDR